MNNGATVSGPRPPARIIFAGSPEFALPCLAVLVESAHDVVAVLTQPDRPAGRGRELRPCPVKQYATEHGLDVLQPEQLTGEDIQHQLHGLSPDLAVIVAYGMLLPPAVLGIPRAGCINVHASVLPRWRGASPIQAAILAGDDTTGVSIMQMDAGLDTGPVYVARTLRIASDDTADSLHDRLALLGGKLLRDTLADVLRGAATATPQDEAAATYAGRIVKADARIDWRRSAAAIDRQIRAYHSWPVGETLLDGQRTRCWAAHPVTQAGFDENASNAPPARDAVTGQVIKVSGDGIDVQTGDGVLRITELQLPGRQRMSAARFANGYPVVGKIFGA